MNSPDSYDPEVDTITEALVDVGGLAWSEKNEIRSIVRKNTTLGKLLNSDEGVQGEGVTVKTKKDYPVSFSEPVFLSSLELSYVDKAKDFTLECIDIFGNRSTHTAQSASSYKRIYTINRAVAGFKLNGSDEFFGGKTRLQDGVVHGCSLEALNAEVEGFKQQVDSYNTLVNKARSLSDRIASDLSELKSHYAKIDETEEEIEALDEKLSEVQASYEAESKDLEKVRTKKEALDGSVQTLTNQNQGLENSIEQLTSDRAGLNEEVSKLKRELRNLHEDKNAFSEDVIEFNARSNEQKTFYLSVASVCLVILGALGSLIGWHAYRTALMVPSWEESINLFFARLPVLTMTIAVTWACYQLIRAFFEKIMSIDRQQLNFSKLAIIAKDVSVHSANGLDGVDEEDIFERRIHLKMDLLKDYLSEELGKQYSYSERSKARLEKASLLASIFRQPKADSQSKPSRQVAENQDED